MLKIDLRAGESISIGDGVTVHLEQKSGNRARLVVDAPKDMQITKKLTTDATSYAAEYGISNRKLAER